MSYTVKKVAIVLVLLVFVCMMIACGKSREAKNVEQLIRDIGTVTIDSEDAISVAEKAYNDLPEELKGQVGNYDSLLEARSTYDSLEAKEVDDLISSIGKVTLDSLSKIQEAEELYQKCHRKENVNNYDDLQKARTSYNSIKNVYDLIDALGYINEYSGKQIEEAEEAYGRLTAAEKEAVVNYDSLRNARAKYDALPRDISLTTTNLEDYFELKCDLYERMTTEPGVTDNHITYADFTITATLQKAVKKISNVSITVNVNYGVSREEYGISNNTETVIIYIDPETGCGSASFSKQSAVADFIGGVIHACPKFSVNSFYAVDVTGSVE